MKRKIFGVIVPILLVVEFCSIFLAYNSYQNKDLIDIKEKNKVEKEKFSMYIENDTGEYIEYTSSEYFPDGYILNLDKSTCVDSNDNVVSNLISSGTNGITVTSNKTVFCYLYFDIATSIYQQVKKDYTNNNGAQLLSETASDTYPVYYYTGDITNNNVLFGNFCWKMVRTTDTGGVKLIYNGVPTDGSCDNTGDASQLTSTSRYNSSYTSPAYVGYMYNSVYTISSKSMSSDTNEYLYGNSFTYSNGTYTLTDTISSSSWSSIYNGGLNSNHYTCFNSTGICTSLYYIYYTTSSTAYYITLSSGKSVEDAINEMLHADNVNTTNSTIKTAIDNWYAENMTSYTGYLENTIFCNNREITSLNGWNPNGGSTKSAMDFNYNSLECANKLDQFTLKVDAGGTEGYGNNALDYPVGLLTYEESRLATGSGYLKSGNNYWLLSPYYFYSSYAVVNGVLSSGYLSSNSVSTAGGVRPVVSLSSSIKITSGDGSATLPYQVTKE